MSKAFVEEDVDNEVDGRVKYDEHVGDGPQVELEAAAVSRLVRRHGPHHPVDERRHLADDEYGDDDYENECDIVVLLLAHTLHLYPRPAGRLQRFDHANVQQHQDEYGQGQAEYKVQDVVIYYVV